MWPWTARPLRVRRVKVIVCIIRKKPIKHFLSPKLFVLINIVDAEEGAGEGAGLAKSDEEGGVNLALRVDEDATEEKDEASEGKDGCG